jgi:polyribonucleotide nucleotidyltransferase
VEKVTDYLSEGQIVRVKVLETDEKGRVKLSMKALMERPAAEHQGERHHHDDAAQQQQQQQQ